MPERAEAAQRERVADGADHRGGRGEDERLESVRLRSVRLGHTILTRQRTHIDGTHVYSADHRSGVCKGERHLEISVSSPVFSGVFLPASRSRTGARSRVLARAREGCRRSEAGPSRRTGTGRTLTLPSRVQKYLRHFRAGQADGEDSVDAQQESAVDLRSATVERVEKCFERARNS